MTLWNPLLIAFRNSLSRLCFSQIVQIENFRLSILNSKITLQSDMSRLYQLERSLSNPEYPYNSFSIGNLESLREEPTAKGLDVRNAFMNFHETHYSANLMKLVVMGRESLDQLQEWVVEKFSAVKNKNVDPPNFEGKPYTKKELQAQRSSTKLIIDRG